MRLAGNQQHPHLVAHTLDGDDGAVVRQRQFIGQPAASISTTFGPPGRSGRHLQRRAGKGAAPADLDAVLADHDLALTRAVLLVELHPQHLIAPDDAERGPRSA